MPAFNLEFEQKRLQEPGLTYAAGVQSTRDSLRTLVAERTNAPSFFALNATPLAVTSVGYEHRGDLHNSFAKSVEEAEAEAIARRYDLENRGYDRVKQQFFSVPLYSTFILFSPPPDEPIPGYPGHTPIYLYHVLPGRNDEDGEKEREIKALSWDTWLKKEEQAEILNELDPKVNVLPTEESILTSPINVVGAESFQTLWNKVREYALRRGYSASSFPQSSVMEDYLLHGEEVMQTQHPDFYVMIDDLATRLVEGATRDEIADDFDTMLKRGDKDFLYKNWGYQSVVQMSIPGRRTLDPRLIFQQNRSSEAVRLAVTFCGPSGGISSAQDNGLNPSGQETGINAWSFTAKNRKNTAVENKILCCKCPFCERTVDAKIEGGRLHCPDCKNSVPYKAA